MTHDIFISHSSKDKAVADAVCAALEAEGIKCWIAPRNINPGQEWAVAIVKAVASSRAMVLVFSDNANHSRDVAKETLLAMNNNLEVIPIKIDNAEPTGTMAYYLADHKWIDATDEPLEQKVQTLVELIKPLIPEKKTEELAKEVVRHDSAGQGKMTAKEKSSKIKPRKNISEMIREKRRIFFPAAGLMTFIIAGLFYFLFFSAGQAGLINSISAGIEHSFILTNDGSLYAFGSGSDGRLGLGDSNDQAAPVLITSLETVKAVSAGYTHTLVLLENGDVYSFGSNLYGPLGIGDYSQNILTPYKIEGLTGARKISAGDHHSLVLLENGDLYAFGWGIFGQLGHDQMLSHRPDQPLSFMYPIKIDSLTAVKDISAGGRFSLVLLESGDLYSFGSGEYGQLGHGDTENRLEPTRIDALSGAVAISAGSYHSLVLLENGDVYSFGAGWNGQLGHGNKETLYVPKKIDGISNVIAIEAGNNHSLVLTRAGSVYSFGSGKSGMLGHGDQEDLLQPTKIEGLKQVTAIVAGYQYSIVATRDGTVYTFGLNESGQLGLGDTENRLEPTAIK